jgi:hypothetical protein
MTCHAVGSQLLVIGGLAPGREKEESIPCNKRLVNVLDMNNPSGVRRINIHAPEAVWVTNLVESGFQVIPLIHLSINNLPSFEKQQLVLESRKISLDGPTLGLKNCLTKQRPWECQKLPHQVPHPPLPPPHPLTLRGCQKDKKRDWLLV